MSVQNILKLNISDVGVLFADTKIVQALLNEYRVPDTYEQCFTKLYHRNIRKTYLNDLSAADIPVFIKPASNDKLFESFIVESESELLEFKSQFNLDLDLDLERELIVYVSDVVTFRNE